MAKLPSDVMDALVRNVQERDREQLQKSVREIVRTHAHADFLAVVVRQEKKSLVSGAPPAWFLTAEDVAPVSANTEAHLEELLKFITKAEAPSGDRVTPVWLRRNGQWEPAALPFVES